MQLHQQDKAEADERRRRQVANEATRVGLALRISPEQVLQRREASEAEWENWLGAAMNKHGADEPQRVLPQILARLEERAALIAREVSHKEADQIFEERIKKALK